MPGAPPVPPLPTALRHSPEPPRPTTPEPHSPAPRAVRPAGPRRPAASLTASGGSSSPSRIVALPARGDEPPADCDVRRISAPIAPARGDEPPARRDVRRISSPRQPVAAAGMWLCVLPGGAEDSSPRAALWAAVRRPPAPPSLRVLRSEAGQASVEFTALLPLVLAIVAVAWQAVIAGQAVWEVRVAARAAARANAFGADAAAAARAHLPGKLERGLRVRAEVDGDVRVSLRVPSVVPSVTLGRVSATSHFRPQGG